MSVGFKTKTELAYEKLRLDISTGKLKPGEKIGISDLSKELGLSGIPIREAMRRLESEGFVKVTPHVGMFVSKINLNEILEIYLVRTELESLVTKLATPRLTDSDMVGLEKTIEKMEMAIKKDNYEKLGPLNKEFHMRIYQASPTPYLLNLIIELWERVHRLESVFVLIPNRALESFEEHKKMLEAARERNGELLAKYVRLQKRNSMRAMVQFAEKNGELVDDLFLKYL